MQSVSPKQLAHKLKMTEGTVKAWMKAAGLPDGDMDKQTSVIVALGLCLDWTLPEAQNFYFESVARKQNL